MLVSTSKEFKHLLPNGGDMKNICLICGQDRWDNQTNKKTPNSPDFKCKNQACSAPFWIVKQQPTHQLKQTPSSAGELVLLSNILEEIKKTNQILTQTVNAPQ